MDRATPFAVSEPLANEKERVAAAVANENLRENGKPFQLVKYISFSSLAVILISLIVFSGFITQRAKGILMHKSEQYASLLAENLNHQVFFQFTLPTLIADGEIRLSRENQYARLDRVVRNTIHGFTVEKVNIYNPEMILTYSTDPEKIGTQGDLGKVFERTLQQESVSVLEGEIKSFLGVKWTGGMRQLVTYVPMWEERPLTYKKGKVLGVFEIIQDVTDDYVNIQRFQFIVILSCLTLMGVVFATILILSSRAEKIIAGRAAVQKKLEEKLHQSERLAALGEMIAGVSHEIRNPLGIIRSCAELLNSRIENEKQKKYSSIIVEEATRLNGIVTEFLDFARPKNVRPHECRLENILERNLSVIEPECQKRGVVLERHYAEGDFTCQGDPDLLYRAFLNLLANAIQAMPEGGTLHVATRVLQGSNGNQMEVRVKDTGVGIPEEMRKKIFNPFFTNREKGTGLGLAIVKSIIDSHHGDIEVQSEEGEGTTMIIRFPVHHQGKRPVDNEG